MSLEQFWYYEPRLLDVYVRKQEIELDNMNYNAWLFGLYTEKAMAVVLEGMFAKKGAKTSTYFEKPIEELNFYSNRKNKIEKEELDEKHQVQVNVWAKLGKKKKGGKE